MRKLAMKTVKCSFCKKDITKHTEHDLKLHTLFRTGYTEKLRTIMYHLSRDKRLLARALKRSMDEKSFDKTMKRLRYPCDINGFVRYGSKGWKEQMVAKL